MLGDTCQIHFEHVFFYRRFPAAVTLDDGSLKRNNFEPWGPSVPLPRQGSGNSFYNGRIGSPDGGCNVRTSGVYQFIRFFIEQGIEGFLHTAADKVFEIVLY